MNEDDEEEIRPMEPEGLIPFPKKEKVNDAPEKVCVPDILPEFDMHVSSARVFYEFLKELAISTILTKKEEGNMEQKKMWYESKTLWVNILTSLWFFIGPVIGIPTLSPELTVGVLGAVNFILRLVTKKEVVFQ